MKKFKDTEIHKLVPYIGDKKSIFIIVKPGFTNLSSTIINKFNRNGWELSRLRSKRLLLSEAKSLYKVHKDEEWYDSLCKYMSSDRTIGMIFMKTSKYRGDIFKEVGKIKDSLRKKYGESDLRNVLHSSDSAQAMDIEQSIYF